MHLTQPSYPDFQFQEGVEKKKLACDVKLQSMLMSPGIAHLHVMFIVQVMHMLGWRLWLTDIDGMWGDSWDRPPQLRGCRAGLGAVMQLLLRLVLLVQT